LARSPKIRITENDRKEYARLVKNTKAKVRNTVKKYGNYIADIERDEEGNTSYRNLDIKSFGDVPALDSFQTRDQFNEWKEKQQAFTSGKNPHFKFKINEKGVAVTDYLLTVAENLVYKANRNERKEREKFHDIPVVGTGMTVAERQKMLRRPTVGGFGEVGFNFKEFDDFTHLGGRLKALTDRADPNHYDEKKRQMKDNWYDLIAESFGSEASSLLDLLAQLSDDEFYALYLHEEEDIMAFELYYNDAGEIEDGTNGQLEQIKGYFEKYLRGELEVKSDRVNDLKGF
jgi:hypothetical protein